MNTATKISQKKVSSKKSGIRTFEAGEVMFHENDAADSLFIIQSGQARLYKPKGKGFVDIAVLRSGEVIGEMAYFDTENRRRSCSAAAIQKTSVVEISFDAFAKTMSGLNPWFKTIINTLANRLRRTNDKVKELEGNSVSYSTAGKVSNYVFFHSADIIKIISTLYLVIKNHGKKKDLLWEIHINQLKFYIFDVFTIQEIKFEEMLNVLKEAGMLRLGKDEDGLPKVVHIENPESLRGIVVFFNTQRLLEEEKKLVISAHCQILLKYITAYIEDAGAGDQARIEVDITAILLQLRKDDHKIGESALRDAIDAGLSEDIMVGDGNRLTAVINYDKVKKVYPSIVLMNIIKKVNEEKASDGKGSY